MKRILLTGAALGVVSLMTPALGADLAPYVKAPASPLYDWSGFYAGVYGGGGFGNHNLVNGNGLNGYANSTFSYDSTGAVAGGELGYNAQSGIYLVGIEASGFWSGIRGNDLNVSGPIGYTDGEKLREAATLVARGGITVDRLLLFFTGGWAYGDILHTNTNPGVGVDQFSVTRSGLTAGGGIAYAVTNSVIAKFEYRYFDFGTYSRPAPTNGVGSYNVTSTYNLITVGLDFKFGPSGPVIAKY
jgi:outer membrane immunogenic protein